MVPGALAGQCPIPEGSEMKVTMTVTIDVDVDDWAREYGTGTTPALVRRDVWSWTENTLQNQLDEVGIDARVTFVWTGQEP